MTFAIARDLGEIYPGHIDGATGIMTVLHGSLSEYLILFGTPAGTKGYSCCSRRERRDHIMCQDKYGAGWSQYCAKVRRRIVPGLY